jgi:ElaB/YqjD/DUF883 family membrane-anchored ribosome-binding protein
MDEATANRNMEGEVNAVQNDMQKLRQDLSALVGHLTSYSKEKLADTRGRLRAATEAFKGRASSRAQETKEQVRRQSHQVIETSRKAIQENPLTCAAIAFCTGAFLSSTRRQRRRCR